MLDRRDLPQAERCVSDSADVQDSKMLASRVGLSLLRSDKDRAQMVTLFLDGIAVLTCPLLALRRVLVLQVAAVDFLLAPLLRLRKVRRPPQEV